MPSELSRRIIKMIENHAVTGYDPSTEQLIGEDDQ
jgi:hypothetical protein